jgi:hypothetical protein
MHMNIMYFCFYVKSYKMIFSCIIIKSYLFHQKLNEIWNRKKNVSRRRKKTFYLQLLLGFFEGFTLNQKNRSEIFKIDAKVLFLRIPKLNICFKNISCLIWSVNSQILSNFLGFWKKNTKVKTFERFKVRLKIKKYEVFLLNTLDLFVQSLIGPRMITKND